MTCPVCGAPTDTAAGRRRAARAGATLLCAGALVFAALALLVTDHLPGVGTEAWLPTSWTTLLATGLAVSALLQGYGAWLLFTRGGLRRCPSCGGQREAR